MTISANAISPVRQRQLTLLADMIMGLQKHEQTLPPFILANKQYTAAQMIAELQTRRDATQAVITAKAVWQAAIKIDLDGRASGQQFLKSARQTLLAAFAGSANALADFGLVPPKVRVVSTETKLGAAAKARATRAARHTLGPKQKKEVKGNVTGLIITPVTAHSPAAGAPVAPATVGTGPVATAAEATAPVATVGPAATVP